MPRPPGVTLGGEALTLQDGQSVGWSLVMGLDAHTRRIVLSEARARRIFERAKAQYPSPENRGTTRTRGAVLGPLAMVIDVERYGRLEVKGLYVEVLREGADPNTLSVLVSDRRILFDRIAVERSYNVRRRTGNFSLIKGALQPIQLALNVPDFNMRRQSMDKGKAFTAKRALEDVLEELCGKGQFVIPDDLALQDSIDSAILHDGGRGALGRILSVVPGYTIFAHPDGRIHVVNTLDQSEIAVAKGAGAPISGQWRVADRSLLRSKRYHVYFAQEPEIRFDFVELDANQSRTRPTPGREPPDLVNVIPVSDPELTLPDGTKVAYGTWLDFDTWLAAIKLTDDAATPSNTPIFGPLTHALLLKHFLANWPQLELQFTLQEAAPTAPNLVWSRRLSAVKQHWRQSFRVPSQWLDKVRNIRANRAAIMDTVTGQRARSDAYLDHLVRPTFRGLVHHDQMGWQVDDSFAADLADAKPSPFAVSILDADVGILRIAARLDPFGWNSALQPGLAKDGQLPDIRAGSRSVAATTLARWNQVELAAGFRLAVVLSVTQDAPNTLGRLHKVTIPVAKALAKLSAKGSTEANGMDTELLSDEETARFAWIDSARDRILEAIFDDKIKMPAELLVNPNIIKDIALAHAARALSFFLDHAVGSFGVSFRPDILPTGKLKAVTHEVRRAGREMATTTTLNMTEDALAPSISALLPESTRRVVRRLVDA